MGFIADLMGFIADLMGFKADLMGFIADFGIYPLVNVYIAVENHHLFKLGKSTISRCHFQ
jgi:hypothetical protein